MGSHDTLRNKPFPPGIHGPSVTFFQDDEQQEIDWTTQERHLEYMVTSGMRGSMFPLTQMDLAELIES